MLVRLHVMRAFTLLSFTAFVCCKQNEDLAQIRALSQYVVTVEPSYNAIADDLYQSCLREANWSDIGNFALRGTSLESSTRSGNRAVLSGPAQGAIALDDDDFHALAVAKALHSGASTANTFTNPKTCDPYLRSTTRWKAVSSILTSYFEALGAAAGPGDDDYGYANLSSGIAKAGLFPARQQEQLAVVATDITAALFDARRRRLTADEASKANAAVATLVTRLIRVADDYSDQLNNEQSDVNSFFRRNFIAQNVGLQTLETIRYRIDWKNALDEINMKRTATAAYVASLHSLADGNEAIVTAASHNNEQALYAASTSTVAALKPSVEALQKALK